MQSRKEEIRGAMFRRRVRRLRQVLSREKADGMLVTDLTNIAYLCGFNGSSAMLLVTPQDTVFFTDFRYIETAENEVCAEEIVKVSRDRFEAVKKEAKKRRVRRLGFEPKALSHSDYVELAGKVGERKLVALKEAVEKLRAIKEPEEIALIRKAVRMTEKALRHIEGFFELRISEKDLEAELEVFLRLKHGEPAFRPIVAFGERSSMPHYTSSGRKLKARDNVLIDFGASAGGYYADLTRTWLSLSMEKEQREIYGIVLEAQQAAIEKVKPGVALTSIDAAAREVIASSGYGERFGHGLGHGIGLNVHELPRIASGAEGRCRKGMVMAIEPGIYIPGRGGVRIEDDVLVTEKGREVLSSFSKTPRSFA